MIESASGLDERDLLRLSLHQAVAAAGALAGVAHVVDAESDTLRLGAVCGLPPRVTAAPWERIALDSARPTARSLAQRRAVWSAPEDVAAPPGEPHTPEFPGLARVGVLVLPMTRGEVSHGALTLFLAEEPAADRLAFLGELAARAGEALPRARLPQSPLLPWWNDAGSRLREAMANVRVGTWEWDLRTNELLLDDAALETAGATADLSADEFDNRIETWMRRIHPDDLPGVLSAVETAIADHSVYSVEYRVLSPEGRVGWVELRGHTTYDENGEPLRMTGTGWTTTTTRMTEQALARILRHMPDGFLLVNPADWRILYANAQASVLRAQPVDLVGHSLWEPEIGFAGLREYFERTLTEDRPVSVDAQIGGTWQRLRLISVDPYIVVVAADVTAEVSAQHASDRRARQITTFTEALAEALTTQDVVEAVAAEILPPFGASSAVVYSMTDGRLTLVGAVGDASDHVNTMRHREVGQPKEPGPWFVSSVESGTAYARLPSALADLAETSNWEAWAQLPLTASGRLVGYLVISFDHPRQFTSDESGELIALSGLVAQGLERARLYDAERARAGQLQQALLPTTLPSLPAVQTEARYRQASDSVDVGGDWYDTIPLSADRVALVIGDVMGHGLHEAITMSRVRTAVSTLATLDHPPEEMLAHLNDVVFELGSGQYVTCLYAVYDSTSGICSVASAGHPSPVVVPPDGPAYFADVRSGPPLGVSQPSYRTSEFDLPEGSLLLLYTDGLIGVADSDPDVGMGRLLELVDRLRDEHLARGGDGDEGEWLGELCDAVVKEVPYDGGRAPDDAAVLAVRTHLVPEAGIASIDLPWDPESAGLARREVQKQLSAWDLDELTMPTELIVSELIGNVVRHARGPVALRLIRSNKLTCEVRDGSQATPRRRHASLTDEDGRGLQLVAAMAQRWGTRYVPGGKVTWAEQNIP